VHASTAHPSRHAPAHSGRSSPDWLRLDYDSAILPLQVMRTINECSAIVPSCIDMNGSTALIYKTNNDKKYGNSVTEPVAQGTVVCLHVPILSSEQPSKVWP
jgi:hypothetical protein